MQVVRIMSLLAVSEVLIVAGGFVWYIVAKASFSLTVMMEVVILMMTMMKMKMKKKIMVMMTPGTWWVKSCWLFPRSSSWLAVLSGAPSQKPVLV